MFFKVSGKYFAGTRDYLIFKAVTVINLLMYGYGSRRNHGCEAIVDSTAGILNKAFSDISIAVSSTSPVEDELGILPGISKFITAAQVKRKSVSFLLSAAAFVLTRSKDAYYKRMYRDMIRHIDEKKPLGMSIGGDNYCYEFNNILYCLNKTFRSKGLPTILWGCSVEPSLLSDKVMLEDLRGFDLITARETITYNALLEAGVTNTKLFPDPAFTLETEKLPLPEGFKPGNTFGLNLSNFVKAGDGIVYDNVIKMIEYILSQTDMHIAFIPHVFNPDDSDADVMRGLYEKYRQTGRVAMTEECGCRQLKGYIARCRFFVGARTHSTIAAYSSCVPTFVIGYSIKSRGIARDIFGDENGHVMHFNDIDSDTALLKSVIGLIEGEDKMRAHLQAMMPEYIGRAWQAGHELRKIIK